jgi:preprotein translocase subunit SecF
LKRTIKFLEYRWVGYLITLILFAVFITGTVMRGGFNWGIDFVGGIKVIAHFSTTVRVAEIRQSLERSGIKAEVQQFGNEINNEFVIMTRLPERRAGDAQLQGANLIESSLASAYANNIRIIGREEVGPAIGDYLKKSAVYLIVWCILLMALYLAFRFETLFSVGAMFMISHDVLLSFLFCGFMGIEINIPIIAGVLTIFGYSINDTIVVYDRIRENMTNMAKQSFREIANKSLNQVLMRTILTTWTTLMAVLCLYLIGESVINDFAELLLFGFACSVFSTVAVAVPVVFEWKRRTEEA